MGFVLLNLQYSVQYCVDHCSSFYDFTYGRCIVCPSSNYDFCPEYFTDSLLNTPLICSTCHKHFSVLSSFMTYHLFCKYINTMGVTSELRNAYPSGVAPRVTRSLILCVCFVCPFVLFLLAMFFYYFADSGYLFGIFKLFFKLFLHNVFFWMTFREMYWHGEHDD